jgi:hypothetical protein
MVYGTVNETHAMPGITSQLSKQRQAGPTEIVTSDPFGNLATDGGKIFARVRRHSKNINQNTEGVAMAMSLSDPDMVGDERIAARFNWGTFDDQHAVAVNIGGVLVPDIMSSGVRLSVSGGAAYGIDHGKYGGRGGFQFSW